MRTRLSAILLLMLCIAAPQAFAQDVPAQDAVPAFPQEAVMSMMTYPMFEQGYIAHHIGVNSDDVHQNEQALPTVETPASTETISNAVQETAIQKEVPTAPSHHRHSFTKGLKTVVKSPYTLAKIANHHKLTILAMAASFSSFVNPAIGIGAMTGVRMLSMTQQTRGLAFAPAKLGPKPNQAKMEEAGKAPYLRYTNVDCSNPSPASIFNQQAYSKVTAADIVKIPRMSASELGLSGARVRNEAGTWACEVTLAPTAIISYNPDTREPLYLNDCDNGTWMNRLMLLSKPEPQKQVINNPPVVPPSPAPLPVEPPTKIAEQPSQAPVNVSVKIEGTQQAPQPSTVHTISDITVHRDWAAKTRDVMVGGGIDALAVAADIASVKVPNAMNHASDNKVKIQGMKDQTQITVTNLKGAYATNIANIQGAAATNVATISGKAFVDGNAALQPATTSINTTGVASNTNAPINNNTANPTNTATVTGPSTSIAPNMSNSNSNSSTNTVSPTLSSTSNGAPVSVTANPTATSEANNKGVSTTVPVKVDASNSGVSSSSNSSVKDAGNSTVGVQTQQNAQLTSNQTVTPPPAAPIPQPAPQPPPVQKPGKQDGQPVYSGGDKGSKPAPSPEPQPAPQPGPPSAPPQSNLAPVQTQCLSVVCLQTTH